jgi:hypothetical protein
MVEARPTMQDEDRVSVARSHFDDVEGRVADVDQPAVAVHGRQAFAGGGPQDSRPVSATPAVVIP